MIKQTLRFVGLLVCLLLFSANVCPAQGPEQQIRTTVAQLEDSLPSLNLPEGEKTDRLTELRAVKEAVDGGYLYLALYKLQPIYVELKTQQYAGAKAELKKSGIQAFEQEWRRLGLELNRDKKLFKSAASSRLAAAVQALAESSFSQVAPYHQSGRLYGLNTEIQYGLYYLGRAPSSLAFALFCQKVAAAGALRPIKLPALDEELSRLEAEVLSAYRKADLRTQEPAFIRVNVTLKIATELNQAAMYAGALQKLLEASLLFASITTPAGEAKEAARLPEEGEQWKAKLTGATDHSVGLLYWEMAQNALRLATRGERPEENRKLATILFGTVLPRYFQILAGGKS